MSDLSENPVNSPSSAVPPVDRHKLMLSANFSLAEFIRDVDAIPAPWVLDNLYRLAHRLQVLRDLLGKPIRINSGYRTPVHNREVGGFKNSYHLNGMAADIVVAGMPPRAVQKFLQNWSGGLGAYPTFTHVDIRPYKARWGEADPKPAR